MSVFSDFTGGYRAWRAARREWAEHRRWEKNCDRWIERGSEDMRRARERELSRLLGPGVRIRNVPPEEARITRMMIPRPLRPAVDGPSETAPRPRLLRFLLGL
jgi:hypothetical protein